MKKLLPLLTVLTLVLAACGARTPQPPTMPVAGAQGVLAQGQLAPHHTVTLSFNLGGPVAETFVKEGDSVTVGQALARLAPNADLELARARAAQEVLAAQQALDDLAANPALVIAQAEAAVFAAEQQVVAAKKQLDELKEKRSDAPNDEKPTVLDLEQAEAQIALAEAQVDQAKTTRETLKQNNGVDPETRAALEARLATAQAAVASAEAALANLELKAPSAGTVTNLALIICERVNVGQPAITLADTTQWVVETDDLTEIEVVNIRMGQTATVTFDALPDQTFTGAVAQIKTYAEEKRGDVTYTVVLTLANPDPQLRWGMTAAIAFQP
jgi:multidrug resistance efflux pump